MPTRLYSLNEGLTTLQFQSISVNPKNPTGEIMGGTQDNGTWLYSGSSKQWTQTIYGDGGQSGFDVANPAIRFNQFFGGFGDVNFRSGDPTAWVIATANPLNSGEAVAFYWPEIADPKVGGTIFTGFQHVWRTKDNGGNQLVLEANCPEFTTPGNKPGCGDFEALGGAGGAGNPGDLTAGALGNRAGGNVAAIERTTADNGTMWAATSTGRVFVSKNADADPASAVTYTRIDVQGGEQPAEPVPERHRRRSGEPEPRLDLVLGLQLDGRFGHARARLRGHLRPGRQDRDMGRPKLRPGRPAADGHRPRRRDRRCLRLERLRGPATGEGHDVVVRRRRGTPGRRGPRAHDRPGRTPAVCGDPRDERLVHEPAVAATGSIEAKGAARGGGPLHNVRTLFGFRFTGSSGGHARAMALRTLAVAAAALAVAVPAAAAAGGRP